jgi:hypothetical protein
MRTQKIHFGGKKMKRHILLFSLITLFVISACGVSTGLGFKTVKGSGDVITETREVSDFSRVDVCCGMVLNLTQGGQESLKIEADDNFMDEIQTRVEDGTLYIQYRNTSNVNHRPSQPVRLHLSAVGVNEVSISGGGKFNNERLNSEWFKLELSGGSSADLNTLNADQVGFQVSGGGDIDVETIEAGDVTIELSGGSDAAIQDLMAGQLYLEISGGGRAAVAGNVTTADIDLRGASQFDGKEMASQEMKFNASGGGHSIIWVEDSLMVTLSGGSSIGYYGAPKILDQQLSGGSDLDSLGER